MDNKQRQIHQLELDFLKLQKLEVESQIFYYTEMESLLLKMKSIAKYRIQETLNKAEIQSLNEELRFLQAQFCFIQEYIDSCLNAKTKH